MRRETSRVSFLMCPFCVRVLMSSKTTEHGNRLPYLRRGPVSALLTH
jgi:hypothetical protein